MKKYLLFTFLVFSILGFSQNPKKCLFIGNSITYFNEMPTLFESIANEKGKNIDVEMYAPGGTGFVNHVNDNNVYQLLQNNVWDYVVLQPGSSESAGVSFPANITAERGNQIQDSIKKYSPCAKIFLYEIPYGVPAANNYANYFQVQNQIKQVITTIADLMEVPLVAAGECANLHYTNQQDLLLHGSYNDIHPNLNGSYLVACAMFCAIFQETVSGVNFTGDVTLANANYFHGIADTIILNNKPLWRINTYNLHAEFTHQLNGNQVIFTNNSANYESVLWDFEDGLTSTELNPQHTYNTTGNKTVTLTVYNGDCSETYTKTITIETLGLNDFENSNFTIFPTLVNDLLYINNLKAQKLYLYNSLGLLLKEINTNNSTIVLDVSHYSKGIYFIKSEDSIFEKFIKN